MFDRREGHLPPNNKKKNKKKDMTIPEFDKWEGDTVPMKDGLHIWLATWCPYSVKMYDAIHELRKEIADSDIVMKVYDSTDLPKDKPHIKTYPAIFFVKDGEAYPYQGDRDPQTTIQELEKFFGQENEPQETEDENPGLLTSLINYVGSFFGGEEAEEDTAVKSLKIVDIEDERGDQLEATRIKITTLDPAEVQYLEQLLSAYNTQLSQKQ